MSIHSPSQTYESLSACLPKLVRCLHSLQSSTSPPPYEAVGPFLLWTIVTSHFHPLLEYHPNGFILITALPSSCTELNKNKFSSNITQEDINAHVHWCRQVTFEYVNHLHTIVSPTPLPVAVQQLLHISDYTPPPTNPQPTSNTPPYNTADPQVTAVYHENSPKLFCCYDKHKTQYEYALLEHRLRPIPLNIIQYITHFLSISTSTGNPPATIPHSSICYNLPVVFLVKDAIQSTIHEAYAPPKASLMTYLSMQHTPIHQHPPMNQHTPIHRQTPTSTEALPIDGLITIRSQKVPLLKLNTNELNDCSLSKFIHLCTTENTLSPHHPINNNSPSTSTRIHCTARYDAIWRLPSKATMGTDSYILKHQSTNSSFRIMAGPLLSLVTSWDVNAPHRELMRSLPVPNTSECDAAVVMRAGGIGVSFIHNFYYPLKLLNKLFKYHKFVMDAIEREQTSHLVDVWDAPLHTEEMTTTHNNMYPTQPIGNERVQQLVASFIKEERSLYEEGLQRYSTKENNHNNVTNRMMMTQHQQSSEDVRSYLTADMESAGLATLPIRADHDFVDRLWNLFQHLYSLNEVLDALQYVLDSIQMKDVVKNSSTSTGEQQLLLPAIRPDNPTDIAKLVNVSLRIYQLYRYGGGGMSEECIAYQQLWLSERSKYRKPHYLPYLLLNMGIHSLCRDAMNWIDESDGSAVIADLDWYISEDLQPEEVLPRLERLQKACEIAVLAKHASLPNECYRKTVKCALSYYQTNDERSCPLFVCALSRLNTTPVVDAWIQHRAASFFTLKGRDYDIKLRLTSNEQLIDSEMNELFDALQMVVNDGSDKRYDGVNCCKMYGEVPVCLWPSITQHLNHQNTQQENKVLAYTVHVVTDHSVYLQEDAGFFN